MEPGQNIGSRLFDPGRCDCLQYHGREQIAWDRPESSWREVPTCRTDPTLRFFCRGTRWKKLISATKNSIFISADQCHVDLLRRCDRKGEAANGLRAEVQACSKRGNCVTMAFSDK